MNKEKRFSIFMALVMFFSLSALIMVINDKIALNSNTGAKEYTLSIEEKVKDRYFLPVSLPGYNPFPFSIDTGSPDIILPEAMIKILVRNKTAKLIGTISGAMANKTAVIVDRYKLTSVYLGKNNTCQVKDVTAISLGKDPNIVIGMNVLERVSPFTIDTNKENPTITITCKEEV